MSRADADKERATRNKLLGRYEGVDSPYIRRRVEELPPGQHKYVGDLVTLYRYVRGRSGASRRATRPTSSSRGTRRSTRC